MIENEPTEYEVALATVPAPEVATPLEVQMIEALADCGCVIPDIDLAVAIVSDFMEKQEKACAERAVDRRMAAAEVLKRVMADESPLRTGLRVYRLAFDLKLTPYRTVDQMARALRVPGTRLSEAKTKIVEPIVRERPCEH